MSREINRRASAEMDIGRSGLPPIVIRGSGLIVIEDNANRVDSGIEAYDRS